MKKKWTSLLLAVVLTAAMLPVTALADEPETPTDAPQNAQTVTIAGAVLTDGMGWDNDGTVTEHGSKDNNAYFTDGTLYLTDLELETFGMASIIVSDGSITVTLTGENYIYAQDSETCSMYTAVEFRGDPDDEYDAGTGTITINGDGALEVESGYAGIRISDGKTTNIMGAALSIYSDWYSLMMHDGTITDSLLTIESGHIALDADALTIDNSIAVLSSEKASISADTLDVRESIITAEVLDDAAIFADKASFADSILELYTKYGERGTIGSAHNEDCSINLNGMQVKAGVTALDAALVSDYETNYKQYSYALISDDPDTDTAWENPYTDVDENKWYGDAIAYVSQYNIMNGIGDDLFQPNGKVSRAQAVQMMYNLHTTYPQQYYVEITMRPTPSNPNPQLKHFADVPEGAWYEAAALWAGNADVVAGVGNNQFNPNGSVTREQFATILHHVARKLNKASAAPDSLSRFKDAKKVSSWAKESMQWAVGAKVMSGDERSLLNPKSTLTRAEAAAMLRNFIQATL